MDTYATTTRNLSCHVSPCSTNVRGSYAPLAPGTGASLEQRSRVFGRVMGVSFTHSLSGRPYRTDLGFGKPPKKVPYVQQPIPSRAKRIKATPLYCVHCSEIRQMNGIDHALYSC